MKEERDMTSPKWYTNRELSWLQFNERVLEEARSMDNPLFERLKFLSITASNLDEFFMVRVASLKDMLQADVKKKDVAGMTAKEQLQMLYPALHQFVKAQYDTLNHLLLPELKKRGIVLLRSHEELTKKEADFADRYFEEEVYPVLTPMAVDSSRPFPLVRNKTLNICALLKKKEEKAGEEKTRQGEKAGEEKDSGARKKSRELTDLAVVQVPDVLPRILELPGQEGDVRRFILLEQVMLRNMHCLFLNYDILCNSLFRIGRDADLTIDEDEAEDLLIEIEKNLKKRQWGQSLRLEMDDQASEDLLSRIAGELGVEEHEIYRISGPLDLTFLMKVYSREGFEEWKEHRYPSPQQVPELPEDCDLFEEIRKRDILMHHPYETFSPVVRFVEKAAADPSVLAIKQTLYRVSGNSPIIAALARAADNGKQVSVLVELKARFDEENNIGWARMLEKAGCHVIYGLVGLKTHCKITLVVRREEDGIKRYVHLATGNYNDSTAKLYTDVGLFTAREEIGQDATAVFNMLSGYSEPLVWNQLVLAPLWLKDRLLYLIQREAERAKAGEPAHIIAKMNSICHPEIIAALYKASGAGVKIDLIVRGICSLKPGIPGVSENITVRSIIGNFLEHSRIFYFANGYNPEVYCSSADWMPRNLERRVEIMFPVEEEKLRGELLHILETELKDTEKAHILNANGVYEKVDRRGKERVNSQLLFGEEAKRAAKGTSRMISRVFVPETPTSFPEA